MRGNEFGQIRSITNFLNLGEFRVLYGLISRILYIPNNPTKQN